MPKTIFILYGHAHLIIAVLGLCQTSAPLQLHKTSLKKITIKQSFHTILMVKGCACYIFASFFVYRKESTFKTRKNVFYFTSNPLFILEIIKFKLFRYSNVMTSKHETQNTLKNLGSKHICNITKEDFLSKNYMTNVAWKLIPGPF